MTAPTNFLTPDSVQLPSETERNASAVEAGTRLDINLKAVQANYHHIKKYVGPECEVAPVIKTNAYGLGVEQIAPFLFAEGCQSFYVANISEAKALREGLGSNCRIFNLGGLNVDAVSVHREYQISPVLNSLNQIAIWTEIARDCPPAAVMIDTGMNRLGIDYRDVSKLVSSQHWTDPCKDNIDLVLSHFACADIAGHPMTNTQIQRFEEIKPLFKGARFSLCNSSGIFSGETSADFGYYDQVRPGMALYGLNPMPGNNNPMKPVIGLSARISQIRHAKKGDMIGYGADYCFERDTQLATLEIGYGDGMLWALGHNKSSVNSYIYWQGQPCPIRGRISMDFIAVDLSGLPSSISRPIEGDWMEIIGPNQSVDALAGHAETIGYEILTSLGPRLRRVYK